MKIRRAIAVIVLIVLVVGLAGVVMRKQTTADTNGIQVVAAENFWGNIASQLGGSRVHVTSIITDPNTDPHLYESSAKDAAAVARADVVVTNGLGYDDFITKLLNASPKNGRELINAQQIFGAPTGANQHLWYDIPEVPNMASKITASLVSKDPSHQAYYEQNLKNFDQSLQPLLVQIAQLKQRYVGTPVAYTEPVPGYLLQSMGLHILTPEGFAKSIEDGDEPSPADASAMETLMTTKAVKVLLYNAQATSPVTEHVKQLAVQAGIPVVGVTETLPPHEKDYQTWQADQLHEMQEAFAR